SSFFFQAEDGIRDDLVTGVQTCALPIFVARPLDARDAHRREERTFGALDDEMSCRRFDRTAHDVIERGLASKEHVAARDQRDEQIGRASCRERVVRWEVDSTVRRMREEM